MKAKKAQLIITAYPVLVLSNAWLEELFDPSEADQALATAREVLTMLKALNQATDD